MLVGAVVYHQVHEDFQPPLVGLLQNPAKQLQVPEVRMNGFVIGYVIAVVRIGGGVERGKPYGVHIQALYIVQLLQHSPEIAYAVSVAVPEAAGPDVVDGHFLIPLGEGHGLNSFPHISLSLTLLRYILAYLL